MQHFIPWPPLIQVEPPYGSESEAAKITYSENFPPEPVTLVALLSANVPAGSNDTLINPDAAMLVIGSFEACDARPTYFTRPLPSRPFAPDTTSKSLTRGMPSCLGGEHGGTSLVDSPDLLESSALYGHPRYPTLYPPFFGYDPTGALTAETEAISIDLKRMVRPHLKRCEFNYYSFFDMPFEVQMVAHDFLFPSRW